MNRTSRRVLLCVVPQVVAAAPVLVVLTALAHRLPERLASHFDAGGTADGFTGRGEMLGFTLAVLAVLVAVFGIAATRVDAIRIDASRSTAVPRGDRGRFLVAGAWGVAALLGVTQCAAVAGNLDRVDPAAVTLPPATMLIGLGVALLAGLAGWAVAGPTDVSPGARDAAAAPPPRP